MGRRQNQLVEFTYINVKGDTVSNLTISVSLNDVRCSLVISDGK